jgi:2-dehydro-3-deoxygluconokinase
MSVELLCMGEPMMEYSQLPETAEGRQLYLEGFGGDTSNTAIAAARQGAKVGYVTAIGRDRGGDAFLSLWRSEGIDTSTVIRRRDRPTAVYFVLRKGAGHEFLFYRAGSAAASYAPQELPAAAVAAARIFYASGISQAISASAAEAVSRAIDIARDAGVAVAYDTNYRARLWPAAEARDVIHAAVSRARYAFVSHEDAEILAGLDDPDAVIDFYLGLGPEVVILKQGRAGAVLASRQARVAIRPPSVAAVDSTGAGDVLSGAFLARILAKDAAETAARYAVAAAALSTRGYGAVAPIPRAAEVLSAVNVNNA